MKAERRGTLPAPAEWGVWADCTQLPLGVIKRSRHGQRKRFLVVRNYTPQVHSNSSVIGTYTTVTKTHTGARVIVRKGYQTNSEHFFIVSSTSLSTDGSDAQNTGNEQNKTSFLLDLTFPLVQDRWA